MTKLVFVFSNVDKIPKYGNEYPIGEITFRLSWCMWSQSTNVTDWHTDQRTDRRTDDIQ